MFSFSGLLPEIINGRCGAQHNLCLQKKSLQILQSLLVCSSCNLEGASARGMPMHVRVPTAQPFICCRAAMFAMLAAFGAEVRTGAPLFVQIQQTPVAIAAAFATIIIASVIPVLRGANLDRDGAGPFTQASTACAAGYLRPCTLVCYRGGFCILACLYCFMASVQVFASVTPRLRAACMCNMLCACATLGSIMAVSAFR